MDFKCPADVERYLSENNVPMDGSLTLTRREWEAVLSCFPYRSPEPAVDVNALAEALAARMKAPAHG